MLSTITRRAFLLSSAALPAACMLGRREAPSAGTTAVRPPAVGQSWSYAKRDMFTGTLVDHEIDEVRAVGDQVEIACRAAADADADAPTSASRTWVRKYFGHPNAGGPLPSEIQGPWGKVVVDPHWNQVQVYDSPLPLWPAQLVPGWVEHFSTRYRTAERVDLMWQQTMRAEAWQTVQVPAGRFEALRFVNTIHFRCSDIFRKDCARHETIWMVPDVGRWVARESGGTYYQDDSVDDAQHVENSYRWELSAWT